VVDLLHSSVDSVFSSVKIFDVELEQVAHDVVEHKKTSSFLNGALLSVVDQIENWSQDLVHSLYVLCSWVYFSKDKQNSSHVIVSIGSTMLIFATIP
jgi:hypothetical protein